MSDIVLAGRYNPILSKAEIACLQAKEGKPLSALTQQEATKGLIDIINRTYVELGMIIPGKSQDERVATILTLAKILLADLLQYFPQITLAEVSNAVSLGIRHEYGEYFGISTVTIHLFVKSYISSAVRQEALRKQHQYIIEDMDDTPKLTQEQIDEIMEGGVERCRTTFLQTGRIEDFCNGVYDYLVRKGRINLTIDEKRELMRQAEPLVDEDLFYERQHACFNGIRFFDEPKKEQLIVKKAKDLALMGYYNI